MGNSYSKEEEERINSMLFDLAKKSGMIPDISMDDSLVKFSGLNSADELKAYLRGKAPDYVTNLGSALTTFKRIPNAVGLGALVISFMIDLIIGSSPKDNSDNTLNMMRRVFGEEKASGVRDSMDEYIKRLCMHVKEPLKALEETERLEKQLSDQLTRLRNSMLHYDQMSTRSMKCWTNGAAFHLQMLIHAARLKMAASDSSCEADLQIYVASVSIVVDLYQKDLQELLEKYTSYKRSTMSLTMTIRHGSPYFPSQTSFHVEDCESGLHASTELGKVCQRVPSDAYLNYMFNKWNQPKELTEYFTALKENIKELILQHNEFSMQNNLPGSDM